MTSFAYSAVFKALCAKSEVACSQVYGFYGVSPVRAYETLDLVSLEALDARMLGVDPGQVVLLFTCYTYDKDDDVIEYTCSYTRGDKCSFTVHNRA